MSMRYPWIPSLILSLGATFALGVAVARADDYPPPEPAPAPEEQPKGETPVPAPAPSDDSTSTTPSTGPATTPAEKPADGAAKSDDMPAKPADRMGSTASASNDLFVRYDGQDLRFEQPRFGGEARLFVRDDSAGADSWTVFRGNDLDAIASANADLSSNPEFSKLRSEIEAQRASEMTADARVAGAVRSTIEAPNLVFEPAVAGSEARLFVREGSAERVYVGSDLDAIVTSHPEIARIEGFDAFRARVTEWNPDLVSIRPDSSAIVDVHYAPEGVTLETYEFREGRWVPQTFRGESIAMLREREPALREVLVVGDESMPTTRPAGERHELPPPAVEPGHLGVPPANAPAGSGCPGVGAAPHAQAPGMAPAAPHGAPQAHGIVVRDVMDASAASAWELQPNDMIVELDGRPAGTIASVREQIRVSGASRPSLVVLRNGQRLTLDAR